MKTATIRFLTIVFFSLLPQLASAQTISGTVNEDGFVVLSGMVDLLALDVRSANGNLLPLPDGNPAPFDFVVENSAERVLLGSVGQTNAVPLQGELVLPVGYDLNGEFDLIGFWGGPLDDQEGEIQFSAPVVPEPSGLAVSMIAFVLVMRMRSRRSI